MAGSLNKVTLIGNLGKDPEIRSTQAGKEIASFSIATSDSWTDKSTGEKKEKTEWHNIAVFNEGLVRVVKQYVKKGSKLYIEGQLQTRKWQDKDGHDRYTTEIILQNYAGTLIMLDGRNSGGGASGYDSDNYSGGGASSFGQISSPQGNGGQNVRSFAHELDDDVPF